MGMLVRLLPEELNRRPLERLLRDRRHELVEGARQRPRERCAHALDERPQQILRIYRARANRGIESMRDHAWFVAFAPTDAPEIAIACIVEHAGGGGGAIAAPVVQQVLSHYFTRNQGPMAPPAVEAGAAAQGSETLEANAVRSPPHHPL